MQLTEEELRGSHATLGLIAVREPGADERSSGRVGFGRVEAPKAFTSFGTFV